MVFSIILINLIYLTLTHQIIEIPIHNERDIHWYDSTSQQLTFSIDIEDRITSYSHPPTSSSHSVSDSSLTNLYLCNGYFLTYPNHNQYHFPLYIHSSIENTFSLSRVPWNLQYSFIHCLHSANEISSKQFAIEINLQRANQSLYIGGIPSYKLKPYTHKLTLQATSNTSDRHREYWGFQVHALHIGNNTFIRDMTFLLSLFSEYMVTSKKVFDWIKDVVLKEHLRGNKCREENGFFKVIWCDKDVLEELPLLRFVVNEEPLQVVEMKMGTTNKEGEFSIVCNVNIKDSDEMYVNRNFFYGKIVEFDYDKNEIGVYYNKESEDNNVKRNKKMMLGWMGVIQCGFVFYLISVKYIKRDYNII